MHIFLLVPGIVEKVLEGAGPTYEAILASIREIWGWVWGGRDCEDGAAVGANCIGGADQ